MKRRDFLRLSGTAAIAGFTRLLRAAPWSRNDSELMLSVAHAAEKSGLTDVRALSGGDAAFLSRDAEVSVYGFRGPLSLDLDAIYRIDGDAVPFHAAAKGSVPVRFTMPVDSQRGLVFEVQARSIRMPLRFSIHNDAVPLRRGRYVVAVHERTSPPDWRALQLNENDVEGDVAGSVLLLTFDYASLLRSAA